MLFTIREVWSRSLDCKIKNRWGEQTVWKLNSWSIAEKGNKGVIKIGINHTMNTKSCVIALVQEVPWQFSMYSGTREENCSYLIFTVHAFSEVSLGTRFLVFDRLWQENSLEPWKCSCLLWCKPKLGKISDCKGWRKSNMNEGNLCALETR